MDIQQKKNPEINTEIAGREIRRFVSEAPTAVAMLDKEMNYIDASARWVQDYGLEEVFAIGKSHYEVFPEIAESEKWKQIHLQALNGETLAGENEAFQRASGKEQYISWKIIPWYTSKQEVGGLIIFMQDITEQRNYRKSLEILHDRFEEEVQKRTRDLKAANKELKAFSYSVSHDLRAPLRSIHGFTNILQEDYGDLLDEEGRRLLNVVLESTVKMGVLIDDILSFSRLGRREIQKEEIDMDWLAEQVVKEVLQQYRDDTVKVNREKLGNAYGDLAMMRQLLQNLISNACKYSSTKSTIKLKIGMKEEEERKIYFVQDNGIGFDMKYHDKMFGVFQRLHSDDEFEGTGVGLALAKRIVAKHKGEIWAESSHGEGATFYFSIPK